MARVVGDKETTNARYDRLEVKKEFESVIAAPPSAEMKEPPNY